MKLATYATESRSKCQHCTKRTIQQSQKSSVIDSKNTGQQAAHAMWNAVSQQQHVQAIHRSNRSLNDAKVEHAKIGRSMMPRLWVERKKKTHGLVGVLDVQVSSEQRSLLLTQSSAGGANGLAGEHGHVD